MSNIPFARECLRNAKKFGQMDNIARQWVTRAYRNMYREKPIRRAPGKKLRLTAEMRRGIHRLSPTDMTMVEIANAIGIRNQGRVSEVLNRKR